MSEWGRVTDDGTVYVRTADGERAVGSWHAGTPQEGLAHFVRRFEQLATEVTLLEQRLRGGTGDPRQVAASAQRLHEALPTSPAVGNLAALQTRVDALLAATAAAVEAGKAERAAAREQAAAQKAELAQEAEALAGSSMWRDAGERLRTIGQDWKRITGVDKKTDDALWERVAAARISFNERRTAHFGALEQQREASRERKNKLLRDAEALAGSTDWKATADRYKQLMVDWKTAGRAPREVEDSLWAAFKGAQDRFFGARNASFAEQDEQYRGNQEQKEAILAEAEALDPANGVDKGRVALRRLGERWEVVGKVPREAMRPLEDRMAAVEEKFRGASAAASPRPESPFVVRLREKVLELEGKLERARAAGRPTGELEASLETQRQWLSQAGVTLPSPSRAVAGPVSPATAPAPPTAPPKKNTGGWVRATD